MVGVITSWDILTHPISTIRCFGWIVFFKAVAPWRHRPFLAQLQDAGFFGSLPSNVSRILGRCIDLELRAKRIYRALAEAFGDQGLLGPFFAGLADQEQQHADLLHLAQAISTRNGWSASRFNPWQDYLPRLEQQMEATEAAVYEVNSVDAALRLVIQIESSEVNQVFDAALAATDAAFVKRLKPFREAMEAHMAYIGERIPELSPRLVVDVRELRARFRHVRDNLG
jgi:hypothetical protein